MSFGLGWFGTFLYAFWGVDYFIGTLLCSCASTSMQSFHPNEVHSPFDWLSMKCKHKSTAYLQALYAVIAPIRCNDVSFFFLQRRTSRLHLSLSMKVLDKTPDARTPRNLNLCLMQNVTKPNKNVTLCLAWMCPSNYKSNWKLSESQFSTEKWIFRSFSIDANSMSGTHLYLLLLLFFTFESKD